MWSEGIEMAKTAYALDDALETGDTGRIIELAELLSGQVKDEVSTRAEVGGWYEAYDKATSHADFTGEMDEGIEDAPDFTKGYALPDGWQWCCFDDGTGSLDAPDGTSYFNYDLASGEMRDENGRYGVILDANAIADRLENRILPFLEERTAIQAEHPTWWVAYGSQGKRDVTIPQDIDRVVIAPGMSMDAYSFSELLQEAHEAADRRFSDTTISAQQFASLLSRAWPEPVHYEGVTLYPHGVQLEHPGKGQGISVKSEAKSMRSSSEQLSSEQEPLPTLLREEVK